MFTDMKTAIIKRVERNNAEAGASNGDKEGRALVGFGPYSKMSRQQLYTSTKEDQKQYLQKILHYPVQYPSGLLDKLKNYILKRREEEEKADDDVLVLAVEEFEHRLTGNNTSFAS